MVLQIHCYNHYLLHYLLFIIHCFVNVRIEYFVYLCYILTCVPVNFFQCFGSMNWHVQCCKWLTVISYQPNMGIMINKVNYKTSFYLTFELKQSNKIMLIQSLIQAEKGTDHHYLILRTMFRKFIVPHNRSRNIVLDNLGWVFEQNL